MIERAGEKDRESLTSKPHKSARRPGDACKKWALHARVRKAHAPKTIAAAHSLYCIGVNASGVHGMAVSRVGRGHRAIKFCVTRDRERKTIDKSWSGRPHAAFIMRRDDRGSARELASALIRPVHVVVRLYRLRGCRS